MVIASLLQGLGVMLTTFFVFSLAMEMGRGEAEARSFAFACLVLANLSLIVTNLSWNKSMLEVIRSGNKTLNAILIITSTCLLMVLYIPVLSDSFHLYPLHIDDLSLVFFVSLLSLSWFEAIKYLMKKEKTKLHPRG
jgi:Ca2+-transporting ATPase